MKENNKSKYAKDIFYQIMKYIGLIAVSIRQSAEEV